MSNPKPDPILIKCMGTIVRILYNDSEFINEILENIKFHTIIKEYAMKELYRLGLIQNFCFDKAIELTQKGRQLVHDSIDESLKSKMEIVTS